MLYMCLNKTTETDFHVSSYYCLMKHNQLCFTVSNKKMKDLRLSMELPFYNQFVCHSLQQLPKWQDCLQSSQDWMLCPRKMTYVYPRKKSPVHFTFNSHQLQYAAWNMLPSFIECSLIVNIFQSCRFLLRGYNFFSKGIPLNIWFSCDGQTDSFISWRHMSSIKTTAQTCQLP